MVSVYFFVDADYDIERDKRIPQTGILIFLNKAPILWYSKQHSTADNSTLSNHFIALKISTELVEPLWYKLQMFGIPIEGPSNMFCENEYVYKNVPTPKLTLKKKTVSICYNKCREAVADGVSRISKEVTATNLDNLSNKLLVQIRRETMLEKFTYWSICEVFFFERRGSEKLKD